MAKHRRHHSTRRKSIRRKHRKTNRRYKGGAYHPLAAANLPNYAVRDYRPMERDMYSTPILTTQAKVEELKQTGDDRA